MAVTASWDGTLRILDLEGGFWRGHPLEGHSGPVSAVTCTQLSGDRAVAVSAGWDKTVRVWDLASSCAIGEPMLGHTDSIVGIACAALGNRQVVATTSRDASVVLWDLDMRSQIERLYLPGPSEAVDMTSTGEIIVAFGWEVSCFEQVV